MQADLRSFWKRFPTGIEVAVASTSSDKLLGVRSGFHRYFHDALDGKTPVVVVPHPETENLGGLSFSDVSTVEMAQQRARALLAELGDAYHFHVASEGGLHSLEIHGETHFFVHNWTVIASVTGEAVGASGSVEVPSRFISGPEGEEVPVAIPGTRRRGGMISSLTAGLETRRSAVATATFHALSSLFYGVLEGQPR